jgi:cell division protein FtsB
MEVGNEVEKTLSCQKEWEERCKLYAEGDKLRAEGDKLYAEGDKLRAEGDKLWAEGDKLYAEGDKLRAESDKLYAEGNKLRAEGDLIFINAVIKTFGNIKLEWTNWNNGKHSHECHLDNGEVYIPV